MSKSSDTRKSSAEKVAARKSQYRKSVEYAQANFITKDGLQDILDGLYQKYINDLKKIQAEDRKNRNEDEEKRESKRSSSGIVGTLKEKATAAVPPELMTKLSAIMGVVGEAVQVMNKIRETVKEVNKVLSKEIATGVANQNMYLGKMNSRLYGLGEETENYYAEVSQQVRSTFGRSSFVKITDLLQNISSAVDQGIAYNYEQRAYIQTIAEKTVSTFDAFDKDLQRLIRLQQADMTIAQFGAEGSLNAFLNRTFRDTSYLSDMYDSVMGIIADSLSQLSFDEATAYSFEIQKWLGSLYSVGFDSSAIQNIAQGLNYLGTGNVSALNANAQLQNLLAMSASKAGLSYANLLTGGLDADNVNKLMTSMVEYLQSIAYNTDNEVVKSAYGEVFGVGISNLRAIQNLNTSAISSLISNQMSYDEAILEAQKQVDLFENEGGLRVALPERIQNTMDNFLYAIGAEIAEDSSLYADWKQTELIEQISDMFHVPILSDIAMFFNTMAQSNTLTKAINNVMKSFGGGDFYVESIAAQMRAQEQAVLDRVQLSESTQDTIDYINAQDIGHGLKLISLSDITGSNVGEIGTGYAIPAEEFISLLDDSMIQAPQEIIDALNRIENVGNIKAVFASNEQAKYNDQINADASGIDRYTYYTQWESQQTGDTVQNVLVPNQVIEFGRDKDNKLIFLPQRVTGVNYTSKDTNVASVTTTAPELQESEYVASSGSYSLVDALMALWSIAFDKDLSNVGVGLYPFGNWEQFNTRGSEVLGQSIAEQIRLAEKASALSAMEYQDVAVLSDIVQGTSYSAVGTSGGRTTAPTLASHEAAIIATASTVQGLEEDLTKSIDDLYTALFVEKKSVKVNVDEISETVLASLSKELKADLIKEIRDKVVDDTIRVSSDTPIDYFATATAVRSF